MQILSQNFPGVLKISTMSILNFHRYFHVVEGTPSPPFELYGESKQDEAGFPTDVFLEIWRIVTLCKTCEMLVIVALKESLCNQENLIN